MLVKLVEYIQVYDTEKVLTACKEVMDIKASEDLPCFEARLNEHFIVDTLMKYKDLKRLMFIANLKEQYDGYYMTESFVAALQCYDSQRVFDEFATFTTKKYPNVQINIKKLLEQIAQQTYQKENYNDSCATCTKRATCTSSSFNRVSSRSPSQTYELDDDREVTIQTKKIKWDKRWTAYTQQQNLMKLHTFFVLQCIEEIDKEEIKVKYLEQLQDFKTKYGEEVCPNLANKERSKAEAEIVDLLHGLFISGATQTVIEHIPYFIFYLSTYEAIFFKYLKMEDLQLLDDLEVQIEGLSTYKKNKIKAFITKVNQIVYAKNGKYYGTPVNHLD